MTHAASPASRSAAGELRKSLVISAWFGLAVGLLDLGVTLTRVQVAQHGLYRNKSPHLLWMTPVSSTLLFLAVGLGLGFGQAVWPRLRGSFGSFVFSLLAIFSILLAVPGIRSLACLALAVGVASWSGPWLAARSAGLRTLVRRTLPWLVLVVLALVAWSFGRDWLAERSATSRRPPAAAGAPNVLLIVMDTVRADATSLYPGGSRQTTPALERLARRGVRFDRAISTAPWTLPSHASLFTGLWPWQAAVGIDRPLGPGPATLAECLARRGYETGGFVANTVFCSREYGLSRGFGHYEDYAITPVEVLKCSSLGWLIAGRVARPLLDRVLPALGRGPRHPFEADVRQKDAAEVSDAALRWVDRRDPGRPFFAFLNFMDAHDPYLLPRGVGWKFARPSSPSDFRMLRDWANLDKTQLGERELALARDAYDDGIAYLDAQLDRLFSELDRRGLLENTVIAVTSDHGENFGKPDYSGTPIYGHAMTLYQAEIRVPLLIVAPGRVPAGAVVDGPVSLRNLPATLLELAGLRDGDLLPGSSLAGAWEESPGPGESTTEAVLAESALLSRLPADRRYREAAKGLMRAVIASDLSYHRIGADREELYHLAEDPEEHHDLVGTARAEPHLERMRRLHDELLSLEP